MGKKFTILGSCVSRDIFNLDKELELGAYYPRTSFQSIFGKKYRIKRSQIKTKSEYHQKLLYFDLTCEFLNHKFDKDEYLIIDFCDERLGVIKQNNQVICSATYEFKISNLSKIIPNISYEDKNLDEWKLCCDKFVDYIKEQGLEEKLILHKFYAKDRYIAKDGRRLNFEGREEETMNLNRMLLQMYRYIQEKLPDIKIIGDMNNQYLCYEEHMWGLSPFHFEDRYYIHLAEQLKRLV